jgi:tRNA-dihydrouridine synthase
MPIGVARALAPLCRATGEPYRGQANRPASVSADEYFVGEAIASDETFRRVKQSSKDGPVAYSSTTRQQERAAVRSNSDSPWKRDL